MGPLLRFELRGESAMACYFLIANWNGRTPAPTLDTSSTPLAIVFALDSPRVVEEIRATLARAEPVSTNVARSAQALSKLLDAKIRDLMVPASTTRPRPPHSG
jgi:hypothetical protein